MDCVESLYFDKTNHVEMSEFKKGMRVEIKEKSIVGEIIEIDRETLTIIYSDNLVAGWNNDSQFNKLIVNKDLCTKLDEGLNSSFEVDICSIKELEYLN